MKEFKLEITFNPYTKDCKVTGPVNNQELCALGLELAKRVLAQHAERSQIVVVPNGARFKPPPLRKP